ncbi:MAG: MATE family efflux transporter, partial [Candidatus Nephrothrix sp. EaCA]
MTFQTYRQFAEGMHLTRMAMIVVIGCNLLNILLNYFLIFGNGGFPAMGIKGAAISTLTARICMAVGMYSYVYYGEVFRLFRKAFDRGNYSLPLFRKMLRLGIPVGGQLVFEGGAVAVSGIMAGWIGAQALAAHQIALQLATISYMTISGLGAAAAIRVGYFFGKKDF